MSIVESAFQPLLGLPCWSVQCGYGSFLTMEFGQPHRESRGQWHLWLYCCDWFLFAGGERIGDSRDKPGIQRAVRELSGRKLAAVTVNHLPGRSVFAFDLGARLCTRPYRRKARDRHLDQWRLFEPTGTVLSLRGDGLCWRQPGNAPPEDEYR